MAQQTNGVLREGSAPNGSARGSAAAKESLSSLPEAAKAPLAADQAPNKPGVTFASQDKLPKLPIPELKSTLKKYLDTVKPLQTDAEHETTKEAVAQFLESDGPILHKKLEEYASDKSSYIEQFWYDSYLSSDNPVVLNLNPFFLLEDDPTPARDNQVTRAASLAISALSFVRAVRKEELPPDSVRGTPLCMFQYERIFATSRIPTATGCRIEMDPKAKHLVVMCRGQFYWFDVLDHNNDLIMTEKDISVNLQSIVDDASSTPVQEAARSAVGVLSTEKRSIWAGLRQGMTEDATTNNAECLSIVDSALFILCLDYIEPKSQSELCTNMLCGTTEVVKGVQVGTCTNRWYDKLQIIVCKNGSAGINFEHTGVDGHTILRMTSDLYTDTILRFAKSINNQAPSLWTSTSPDPSKRDPASFGDVSPTPHKLEWTMTPELALALRFAETRLADLIAQSEFEVLEFKAYGKNFITRTGFSPDAFVQMAFQAAYYGLYGRVECTYEPAMTKMFLHGRTEAIRSATQEATDFVKKFWADLPAATKIEALETACKKHTAITKECSKGLGQDRHLYALYSVWIRDVDSPGDEMTRAPTKPADDRDTSTEMKPKATTSPSPSRSPKPIRQLPSLFADPAWDRLNTTIISTSNCGNPSLRQFGFGPTSGDGFGLGYIIKDDSISICASSKHRQTRRFVDSIERYFLEIRGLLRASGRGDRDGKASRAREAEGVGRVIGGKEKGAGVRVEEVLLEEDEDDDLLGGCKFFPSFLPGWTVLVASRTEWLTSLCSRSRWIL